MLPSPSIVPRDVDIYLVEDGLGRLGRVWREAESEGTDLDTVLAELFAGQYKNPLRVIAFNTSEGWSRGASDDVAIPLQIRCGETDQYIAGRVFVERHTGTKVEEFPLSPPLWSA